MAKQAVRNSPDRWHKRKGNKALKRSAKGRGSGTQRHRQIKDPKPGGRY